MAPSRLLDWSSEAFREFGSRPQLGRHRLPEVLPCDDDWLSALLDRYPRELLGIYTMGLDPVAPADWHLVEPGDCSGAEILTAVKSGRLWVNVRQANTQDPHIRRLTVQLFTELADGCPDQGPFLEPDATLLISSPGAHVYYHIDTDPNLLWQLRGRKRVWVYPAADFRIVDQREIERICAGLVLEEDLSFRPEFDRLAELHELSPGLVLSWPQHAPHRVVNEGFNVSLSTFFTTPAAVRRIAVQVANLRIARRLGIRQPATRIDGPAAELKLAALRALRRWKGELQRPVRQRSAQLLLDPNAPGGCRRLQQVIPARYR